MIVTITGMSCQHCQKAVENALSKVAGVEKVTVDLSQGTATITGNASETAVIAAVQEAGYGAERS